MKSGVNITNSKILDFRDEIYVKFIHSITWVWSGIYRLGIKLSWVVEVEPYPIDYYSKKEYNIQIQILIPAKTKLYLHIANWLLMKGWNDYCILTNRMADSLLPETITKKVQIIFHYDSIFRCLIKSNIEYSTFPIHPYFRLI